MAYALLALGQVGGLLLVPFGLPGTWLQVLALGLYAWVTGFTTVGWVPIAFVVLLALAGELLEFWLGARYAQKYGGGKRAAWGAILGGIAGAIMGVPVPIVGSVVGAFLGSFVGAAAFELMGNREMRPALRAGWGAFVGRLLATAAKAGIGVAIAAVALFSAVR